MRFKLRKMRLTSSNPLIPNDGNSDSKQSIEAAAPQTREQHLLGRFGPTAIGFDSRHFATFLGVIFVNTSFWPQVGGGWALDRA
jgi:hypothetical protein